VQFACAVLITMAGFYFQISRMEWIIQVVMIGMVLATEGMNTAVEKIADFIHPEYHEKIGFIKDIAAGAVMFVATCSLIVAALIYFPRIF
jgi:diacylglycerol kinase (ATP)